jgi:hypothetical protein
MMRGTTEPQASITHVMTSWYADAAIVPGNTGLLQRGALQLAPK